ncbi:allophanate hydrolase [Idiomarina tyrosinivorans]|uniref:Allophanate hydrolase n=1 Tax=Idiomarina tyrosinivorans TaxID=1445662 RepID=A0A432ZUG7_9GAMM|nr:biotin-dependent carboxyltransferase family protein [Idiomarina tyrosinivorans]RUO81482.1 allophanate hydrolase [Idiomarina tyrosinivorans]
MSNGVIVVSSGMQSLIQDFGRFGYLASGITRGGPVDEHAFLWANRLLGNHFNCAQIECLLGGLEVEFSQPTAFVVTGAEVPLTLDKQQLNGWQTYTAEAGQRLKIGFASAGVRSYLAVAGGFQVAPKLGSCATVTREQLGGLDGMGKPLQDGDEIACKASSIAVRRRIGWPYKPNYSRAATVGVVPAFQFDDFSEEAQACFEQGVYTASQQSDRMGVRLQGPAVAYEHGGLISEGISIGAIQIPPDGQPIIMLNDRQTLGGYPKLGVVSAIDLGKVAQTRPDQDIRFTFIDQQTAQQQARRFYRFFGVKPMAGGRG